jgi:protein SCO1/2
MNKKKLIFLAGFFLLLFAGFYFALGQLIPGFGKPVLPVLSYVPSFSFRDQEGRLMTDRDLSGKVYVADYFFTTCKGICPKLSTNMKKLAVDFAKEPDFELLSFTVDPETDSVGRMKKYADSLGADPGQWHFLTGRKDSLYHLARTGYLLDDPKNNLTNINEQFLHTQFLALVDRNGRVRKVYDGLKRDELDELENDIAILCKRK